MYSLKDTKKIYNLAKVERKLGVEFGELSDIWDYLMLIFSKTAFFSNRITSLICEVPYREHRFAV